MRVAVLSDVHANLEALRATLRDVLAQDVDRIVCLGDVVGYNTDPAECIAALREHDPLWIAGNHDRAVTGQIGTEGFSDTACRAISWTRERLGADVVEFLAGLPLKASIPNHLVAVHGALHPETGCEIVRINSDERRRLSFEALVAHPSRARICAFGHTHRVEIFELRAGLVRARTGDEVSLCDDAYYLINPGTVGEPRTGERRATYLVLDLGRRVLKVRRVAYDASRAFAKTRKAGLSAPFSFLPIPVRNSLSRGARTLGVYDLVKRMVGSRARRSSG
jgi:predicted phosphodiesterase